MKTIAERTGAKLRVRGRGSRFLEGPEQVESTDPLMLCISATQFWSYEMAVDMAWKLMECIYVEFGRFCVREGHPKPDLQVQLHAGSRAGAR
jgi:hypothetical protein